MENPTPDQSLDYVEPAGTLYKGFDDSRNRQLESTARATNWLIAAIGIPLIFVWLGLGGWIIYQATSDSGVLDNIEGLLTALAVLTIPASKFVDGALRKWLGSD